MTLRPKRSDGGADPAEFRDPLKNYEPPEYADELERSLTEDTVEAVMQTRPFRTIDPQTPIEQAMRLMVDLDVACLLVTEHDRLVGIFSERDVLAKVADDFETMRSRPVGEVMTPKPVAVYQTDSPAKALNVMVTGGFRHVPILDVDDKLVGILGPRRVTAYVQKYLAAE